MELGSEEMNSDLGNGFVPKTIAEFLQEVSSVTEDGKKLAKIDEYVLELEKEMKKINVFKRELPVCMLLLGDAIDRLKGEVVRCNKGRKGKSAVMENFNFGDDDEIGVKLSCDLNEKKNWMSSAQLWTTPVEYDTKLPDSSSFLYHNKSKKNHQEAGDVNGMGQKTQLQSRSSVESKGGAFTPFKKHYCSAKNDDEEDDDLAIDGLSLSPPVARGQYGYHRSSPISQASIAEHPAQQQQQQQPKKQRRSWSPDLHRRFVNALEQLGGAQEATPKQIRELMQVADLTNDEVKSHLQKYRLHVRKMANATSSGGGTTVMDLNLDILGRELKNNNKNKSSQQKLKIVQQSGSPQGPLNLGGSSSKGISVSLTIGESLEDEEDDNKSESHSWKGRARSR